MPTPEEMKKLKQIESDRVNKIKAEIKGIQSRLSILAKARQDQAKAAAAKAAQEAGDDKAKKPKRIPRTDEECMLELKVHDLLISITPTADVLRHKLLQIRKKMEELRQSRDKAGLKGKTPEEAILAAAEQDVLNKIRTRVSATTKASAAQIAAKARTHRLVNLGGLLDVAGVQDWPEARIVGCLLEAAASTVMGRAEAWEKAGHARLQKRKQENEAAAKNKKALKEAQLAALLKPESKEGTPIVTL